MLDWTLPPKAQNTLLDLNEILEKLKCNVKGVPVLLRGPKGVGKATLAYHFSKHLFSSHDFPKDQMTYQVSVGSYPNLLTLEIGEDNKIISVDEVKFFLKRLQQRPAIPGWRVVIIDALNDLNHYGYNALLKSLEEPSQQTQFILIAHHGAIIPATIQSRCMLFSVPALTRDALQSALPHINNTIALGAGTIGQACFLNDNNAALIYEQLKDWVMQATSKKLSFLPHLDKYAKNPNEKEVVLYLLPKILEEKALKGKEWIDRWFAVTNLIKFKDRAHLDPTHLLTSLFLLIEDPRKNQHFSTLYH